MDFKGIIRCWVEEVIVGQNICPFAKPSLEKLEIHIIEESDHAKALKEAYHYLKEFKENLDKTYLVAFPFIRDNFIQFYNFSALVEEEIRSLGWQQNIQLVTFHPKFRFEGEKVSARGNYVNRSPFPLLHFLNFEEVSEVVDKHGAEIGEEISLNNNKKIKDFTEKEFQEKISQYIDSFWPISEGE